MANEFKIKKGLIVTGASGGTVVDIQGSQGQLFSVTDDLSGSIFAVSDISGVPILDVNSSGVSYFDGSLGIGTANPSRQLEVVSSSGIVTVLTSTTGGSYISMEDSATTSDSQVRFGAIGNNAIIKSGGTTTLSLDTSQNAVFTASVKATQIEIESGVPSILFDETDVTPNWRNRVQAGGYRIQYASDGTTFTDYISLGANAFTLAKDTTFTEQAFSAATSSGDASSTLTTKGYVDSLITNATIYRGAWDPSGGGYGSPDLSGVTQTSGYYYICSAAGTAEPNGTGTEPDTWETGDWVIYNDVSGTGQWQKIDNSSVLSGVGTGQTVALWEGAGSVTDSETLGNSIITQQSDDEISILSTNATTGQNGKLTIYSYDDGDTDVKNLQLTINNGGDASITNTGPYLNLTALNYIKSNNVHIFNEDMFMYFGKYIRFLDATSPQDSWNRTLGVSASDVVQVGGIAGYNTGKGQLALFSNNAQAIFIDEDQGVQFNAYGAGTLVSDASGNITVSSGGGAGGPYLPLAGGTMTGALVIGYSDARLRGGDSTGRFIVSNSDTTSYISLNGSSNASPNDISIITDEEILFLTGAGYSEAMRIDSAGNVGIGTTNPGAKLEVNSDGFPQVRIHDEATGGAAGIRFKSFTATANDLHGDIFVEHSSGNETGRMGFRVPYTNERLTILSTGNVGIGTTTPDAKLEVRSDGWGTLAEMIRFSSVPGASGYVNSIVSKQSTGAGSNTILGFDLSTGVSGVQGRVLTLLGDGNVGIGTDSPDTKLEVAGITTIKNSKAYGSEEAVLRIGVASSGTNYSDGTFHNIVFGNESVANSHLGEIQVVQGDASVSTASDMRFFTNSGGGNTATNERMRIANNGNVGIGTTSPLAKLDIQGTQGQLFSVTDNLSGSIFAVADISGVPIFDVNSSGVSYFDGSLGIGTTPSSGTKLEVNGQTIINSTNVATGLAWFNNQTEIFSFEDNSGGGRLLLSDTTVKVAISANSNSYFNGGNVGIGTTSPAQLLDVNGIADINSIIIGTNGDNIYHNNSDFYIKTETAHALIFRTSNVNRLTIASGGKVGIGTTSPGYKLTVDSDTPYGGMLIEGDNAPGLSIRDHSSTSESKIYVQSTASSSGNLRISADNNNTATTPTIEFQIGGSEKMRISDAGNVGIGTTNPSSLLDISGNSNSSDNMLELINTKYDSTNTTGETGILFGWNNHVAARIAAFKEGTINRTGFKIIGEAGFNVPTTIATFRSTGNVGIGTTSPQAKLHVSGGSSIETTLIVGAEGTGNDKSARVFLNEGEGGVTNSKDYGFSVAYDGQGAQYGGLSANQFGILRHNNSAAGAAVMVMNRANNNTVFSGTVTGTNFILSSDERLKENVEKACDNRIKADWKTFELKTDKGQKRYGVIAQELEKTNPEFVREDTQGFKSVAYIDLLIAKIAELEARLEKAGI